MYIYFVSESHRQRYIADGAIKETDWQAWTPALAKSVPTKRLIMFQVGTPHPARREVSRTFSDLWESQSSLRLQIRCHIRSTLSPPPPPPPFDTGEPTWRGTSKREVSRALSGSATPSPHNHPTQRKYLSDYTYLDDSFYHRFEHSVTPRTQEEDECRLFQSETGYRFIGWV